MLKRSGLFVVAGFALVVALVGGSSVLAAPSSSPMNICVHKKTGSMSQLKAKKCPTGTSLTTINKTGLEGKQGPVGQAGLPGLNGSNGASGSAGPSGAAGEVGPTGPVGPTGAQGASASSSMTLTPADFPAYSASFLSLYGAPTGTLHNVIFVPSASPVVTIAKPIPEDWKTATSFRTTIYWNAWDSNDPVFMWGVNGLNTSSTNDVWATSQVVVGAHSYAMLLKTVITQSTFNAGSSPTASDMVVFALGRGTSTSYNPLIRSIKVEALN
jgi:hypothetical protein